LADENVFGVCSLTREALPELIKTKGSITQTPMGRLGEPHEIANAVLLLASDEAGWVTGQVLQASGGLML